MKQKGLAPLVIIILIALAVGGILLYQKQLKPVVAPQQTTQSSPNSITFDETTNWKIYTNTERGFIVMHPSDWIINGSSDELYIISPAKAKDNQTFYVLVGISEQKKPLLADYVKNTYPNKKMSSPEDINGITFYKLADPNDKFPHLITKLNDEIVDIRSASGFQDGGAYYYNEKDPVFMTNIRIANRIISTIRFVEQNDVRANWKTYTSKVLGLTIQYPPTVQFTQKNIFPDSEYIRMENEQGYMQIETLGCNIVYPEPVLKDQRSIGGVVIDRFKLIPSGSYTKLVSNPKLKNGRCIEIVWGLKTGMEKIAEETFDQILSTFKFLEEKNNTLPPTSEELNGFPIYPNSKFIKKEESGYCKDRSGYELCTVGEKGVTTYTWTSDEADKVWDWYNNDPSNSGWKKFGGAGAVIDNQNYGGQIGLKKGDVKYYLNWYAQNNRVEFTLGIPK